MTEKLRQAAGSQWTKQFVGSIATVMLSIFVAWIGGIVDLKEKVQLIAAAQATQTRQLVVIESKMDEREKTFNAAQLNGSLADSELKGQIGIIKNQYEQMLQDLNRLKSIAEIRKR